MVRIKRSYNFKRMGNAITRVNQASMLFQFGELWWLWVALVVVIIVGFILFCVGISKLTKKVEKDDKGVDKPKTTAYVLLALGVILILIAAFLAYWFWPKKILPRGRTAKLSPFP